MQIKLEKIITISNKEFKKQDLLNDLCEYSVLLNKSIIPFSRNAEDNFYKHHFSSGVNYATVRWPWQLLNELDQERKIEILDEFGKDIKISDLALEDYKAKNI